MAKRNKKLRSGYYDAFAPKFRYVRDPFSFTRKTSRMMKGDSALPGDESKAPTNKRASSLYPWTKPMIGWKRVYAGQGKWVSKGRQPRNKQGVKAKSVPSKRLKQGFTKFPRTYGWS